MTDELDWTCENCKYVDEDMEGTHCRHCIHNAEEHFEPKEVELSEQEIRAKAIDEFAEQIKRLNEEGEISVAGWNRIVDNIAEQMKAGGKNE